MTEPSLKWRIIIFPMLGSLAAFASFMTASSASPARLTAPDCSGIDQWPSSMAFAALKNAGLLNNNSVDFRNETNAMIVSQRIAKDRWRQVFLTTFPLKSEKKVIAIVQNDASLTECSMADPKVYVISRVL